MNVRLGEVYLCMNDYICTQIFMSIYVCMNKPIFLHIDICMFISMHIYVYITDFVIEEPLGYFIVGMFCYICSFLLFVWLFFFNYALLAVVYVSHAEDRFFNTPLL
jgi:hypothetical protein